MTYTDPMYQQAQQYLSPLGLDISEEQFKHNQSKKVIVGMSGGVDSSVAALILKLQGHQVIGMFMKNWDEKDQDGFCSAEQDFRDVVDVCENLDIPYYTVNFVQEYWNNVFQVFLEEYKKGLTPNPDILCNREIKFKYFYQHAIKLGADYLATGHYCRTKNRRLLKGLDAGKDQSYFLYAVKGEVLKKVLFPLGEIEKKEVRALAKKFNLITHKKKDSTGICFIGERNFRSFLSQYIKEQKGKFKTLDGEVVGEHQGACFYTPGQRKGLGLGGAGGPWFVVGKSLSDNTVYVERGRLHPALYSSELLANDLSWIDSSPLEVGEKFHCKAKVRYRQKDQDCTIELLDSKTLKVSFSIPQRSLSLRQSIVFYSEETCLGGALISDVAPSYYHLQKKLPEIVAR